jgi:DNA-binding transcriptional LysR family regulator
MPNSAIQKRAFARDQPFINRNALEDPSLKSVQCWAELRVFLAVAKAGSFNRASEILGVSQPTVSRQVRRLQDLIGMQLLVTTKHGVMLTEKGRLLAESVSRLDEQVMALTSGIQATGSGIEGMVRVAVTDGLGATFVAPGLGEFSRMHPKVAVHLKHPINLVDLRENQTDIMIGYAAPTLDELAFQPAGHLHLTTIASRLYIDRYGYPTRDNVHAHRFVQSVYYSARTGLWDPWLDLCAKGLVMHQSENPISYAMLVKAGYGIGLLANYTMIDRLAVPLDLGAQISVPIFVVAIAERLRSRPVRAVFDWLSSLFGPNNPWFADELHLDASSKFDAGYRRLFNLSGETSR